MLAAGLPSIPVNPSRGCIASVLLLAATAGVGAYAYISGDVALAAGAAAVGTPVALLADKLCAMIPPAHSETPSVPAGAML